MFDAPLDLYGAAGAVVIGAVGSVWLTVSGRRSGSAPAPSTDARRRRMDDGIVSRAVRPIVGWIASQARRLTPATRVSGLDRRVRLAGLGAGWTTDRVLAAKLALGAIGTLAGFWYGGQRSGIAMPVFAVFGAAFGYLAPDLVLWGRARERQGVIRIALPDALDQMTICVESGLGFDQALQRVAERGSGPLAAELQRSLSELTVGIPRREALGNLVDRTDVDELRRFVVAVRQADEYGLPVARVLRVQAGQLRMRRRLAAEERAMKMPVKIVFPLVLCIFPALFVVLLGPAMIRIMNTLL
ncbi:MAG: type II secretion system F family protein [Acidimicrobiia bacterium]|nr:type II secretion system F family protein [Acidimicrobiia bacterium]